MYELKDKPASFDIWNDLYNTVEPDNEEHDGLQVAQV